MTCPACGGVVGRDCFNPEECMAITRDMADRYNSQSQAELHLEQCESALSQCQAHIHDLDDKITEHRRQIGLLHDATIILRRAWSQDPISREAAVNEATKLIEQAGLEAIHAQEETPHRTPATAARSVRDSRTSPLARIRVGGS